MHYTLALYHPESSMAVKPPPIPPIPPISEVMQQVNQLVGPSGLAQEVDKNAKQLIQSALRKLDFVSREEFDAQCEILERTQKKVAMLESELAAMTKLLDTIETRASSSASDEPRR
ncbi:MAG: accessory factor UbiK family protein [Pseudomonadota bacterium]